MSDAIKSAGQSLINGSTGKNTDVPALVAALVNSRVAGLNAANTAKQKISTSQLTAVGSLKSVLSLLQSALTTLSNGTALSAVTAKADGKGRWRVYDPERNAHEVVRFTLSAALPAAMAARIR